MQHSKGACLSAERFPSVHDCTTSWLANSRGGTGIWSPGQLCCSYQGFVVVQSLIHVQLFTTPWTAAEQDSLSFTISWSLLKLMSIESMMPSNHLVLCRPLLFLPSVFPSISVFSSKSAFHIRWPKYWNFSFSISPPKEHSGLISFKIVWFDLLAVHGTLRSLNKAGFQ